MQMDRETIFNYLNQNFGINSSEVQGDTPLFTSGLLDSFSVGDLLMFLEDNGKFEVEAEEVVPENLDSVDRIVAFAQRKLTDTEQSR